MRLHHRQKGQSLVEIAITMPILILIAVGIVEAGVYYNNYLTLIDGTREGARRAVDNYYIQGDASNNCDTTIDFYKQSACLVLQNLYGIKFNPSTDDIVISVIRIDNGTIKKRYMGPSTTTPAIESNAPVGEQGWSYCTNVLNGKGCTPAASYFNNAAIMGLIEGSPDYKSMPNVGMALVEIYHLHHQFLGLVPPGLPFLPTQIMMHAYTIMPVASATNYGG
jgi:hypothetical protein